MSAYHRSPKILTATGNPLPKDDSAIELLGGFTKLQFNYKPVMPDLYVPFREMEPLILEHPANEVARMKVRREKRKQPRLPKVSHCIAD